MQTLKKDDNSKGLSLSYAWEKVQDHDVLMLFDHGSTHKFISTKLATNFGIHDFEMGEVNQADGDF